MKRIFILLLFLPLSYHQIFGMNKAGDTIRAMFLGNSYTAANNLPDIIADIAQSMGDTLIWSSNTPGGYTFQQHSNDAMSTGLISQGGWDYMILQEQSQRPSFPIAQVEVEVFPYARMLDSVFNANNPCGETVFYMTWGRKNGDAANCPNWPPVCTYEGMDSLLHLRYRMMADSNDAILSPVGAVWHYIRDHYPQIELYDLDESHPSPAGSYAAACSFYTVMYRKDPVPITFDFNLPLADATIIKNAVSIVVYDSLYHWNVGKYDPDANFTYSILNYLDVTFTNLSANASQYFWDFGDGITSVLENPSHTYITAGNYDVSLIAKHCSGSDTLIMPLSLSAGLSESQADQSFHIFPLPAENELSVVSECFLKNLYHLIITDMRGRSIICMHSVKCKSQHLNIDLLQPGVYVLEIMMMGGNSSRFKFIKK